MTNQNSSVQYQFGLKIGQKELHLGGDKIFVETQMEKWLRIFEGQLSDDMIGDSYNPSAPAGSHPTSRPDAPAAGQRRLPTLGEFFKTKEPKEISDMILVVGLYMERFQQKNLFTRSDLMNTVFNRLGRSEEEVQQVLVELVNKTMLTETATMGSSEMSYSLTFTGEQVVKDGFSR